jgi:hypothetical protein
VSATTTWSRAPRVAHVDSGDRVVVLPLDGLGPDTTPVALDGVAQIVWDVLDRSRTGAEIVAALGEINPDHGLTEADLAGFLDDLRAAGILVTS